MLEAEPTRTPSLILIEANGSSGRRSRILALRLSGVSMLMRAVSLDRWPGMRFDRVADSVHGADQVRSQLAAQRLDVAVHGPRAGGVDPVPDVGQQLLAGQDGARVGGQPDEEVELRGSQMHLGAVPADPAFG